MRVRRNRRMVAIAVCAALGLAACGGGGDEPAATEAPTPSTEQQESSDTEAPTVTEAPPATEAPATTEVPVDTEAGSADFDDDEQAAADVAVKAFESIFHGDVDGVLEVITDACRESVTREQIQTQVDFASMFLGATTADLDAVTAKATAVEIDGDNATVTIQLDLPDSISENDEFGLEEPDDTDLVRDGDRWAMADCDFDDSGFEPDTSAADIDGALADLGLVGSRDEPIPANLAAPVGSGLWITADAINPDAGTVLTADPDNFVAELSAGSKYVLVSVSVANPGPEEPVSVSSLTVQMIGGGNPIGYDSYACGSIPNDLLAGSPDLFAGGTQTGDLCFMLPADEIEGALLSVEAGYSGRSVFFDPATPADSPTSLTGATGVQSDAILAAVRQAPIALGVPTDVGGGWTMTVESFVGDATAEVTAASEYNSSAPAGQVYALATVTLQYDGEDDSASAYAVDVKAVGDSNVSSDDDCYVDLAGAELDQFTDVFKGGTLSGQLCFTIPPADGGSLLLYASGDYFETDPVFFATR